MQRDTDRFEQLVIWEWLAEQAHTPGFQDRPIELEIVARGDEDDGNIDARGAQARLNIEAGETGHVYVEDHAVGEAGRERCEKLLARPKGSDFVVGQTQQASERSPHRHLVVDHGDTGVCSCHLPNVTALRVGPELAFGLGAGEAG